MLHRDDTPAGLFVIAPLIFKPLCYIEMTPQLVYSQERNPWNPPNRFLGGPRIFLRRKMFHVSARIAHCAACSPVILSMPALLQQQTCAARNSRTSKESFRAPVPKVVIAIASLDGA